MADNKAIGLEQAIAEASPKQQEKIKAVEEKRANSLVGQITPLQAFGDNWLDDPYEKVPILFTDNEKKPFLHRGIVGMVVAPGKTGKSFFLLQMAVSLATGKSLLDSFTPTEKGKTLLLFGEEEEQNLRNRLRSITRILSLTKDEKQLVNCSISIASLRGINSRLQGDGGDQQEKELTEALDRSGPWSLIVLDPASRFMGPNAELDSVEATKFIEVSERISQVSGTPTVLISHHTNKSALDGKTNQGAARGSSGLVDACRWVLNIDRVPVENTESIGEIPTNALRFINNTAANYGPIHGKFIVRNNDSGVFVKLSEVEADVVREHIGSTRKAEQKPRQRGYGKGIQRSNFATKDDDECLLQ